MRSGGGHYSALLVPLLLWAAIHGVRRLAGKALPLGLAAVAAAPIAAQLWVGVTPLRPDFRWPTADPRVSTALASLSVIPAGAPVSATSALYPHLSSRHDAYWFPSVSDADWLALDVAGATHPLSPEAMRDAAIQQLERPDMELVSANAGVLVVRRRPAEQRDGLLSDDPTARTLGAVVRENPEALPADFYSFARQPGAAVTAVGPMRFGDALELVGYQLERTPQVGLLGSTAQLATYWRALQPLGKDFRFALLTTRMPDGALSGVTVDPAATPLWYPTSRWRPGETMRLDMSLGEIRAVQSAGVTVMDGVGRLPVSGPGAKLWDGGTAVEVVRLN
jgi:hypothetical protein